MTLGQGATVENVIQEIMKILCMTGGKSVACDVGGSTSLQDAVDHAALWFEGKVSLFLVDDIWPVVDCKTGFLMDLRQLLRDSLESRMAISTRSTVIAQYAGAVVMFEARDPLSSVSEKIFMAHATSGLCSASVVEGSCKAGSSILKILRICAGLPIALAVTGCAVAFLSRMHGDFESACGLQHGWRRRQVVSEMRKRWRVQR